MKVTTEMSPNFLSYSHFLLYLDVHASNATHIPDTIQFLDAKSDALGYSESPIMATDGAKVNGVMNRNIRPMSPEMSTSLVLRKVPNGFQIPTKVSQEELEDGGHHDRALHFPHPPLPFLGLHLLGVISPPPIFRKILGTFVVRQRQNGEDGHQEAEGASLHNRQSRGECMDGE